ncbi:MAG: methyltransferase domain-containing protein, partial [Opitutales bacterium]|nr:methyltransferase domain-containing protein [Opitutales bacterium]
MSDYELAMKQRAERIAELRAKLLETLPADVVAGTRGLTLEIGCGHGHFLAAYAQAFPQEFCLGLDLISKRIERANRKRELAGLTNLAFFKAEATERLLALP